MIFHRLSLVRSEPRRSGWQIIGDA